METDETRGSAQGGHDTENIWDRYSYRLLGGLAMLIIAIGTVVYHVLEDWSWVDSFYFSTVAVTTVGFGDLAPTTDGAKLFTVAYILAGIGVIGTYLNERLKHREWRRRDGKRRAYDD